MHGSVAPISLRRLWPLLPLGLLVISACTQAAPQAQFNGSQPRTPLSKIATGGDMKNFTLIATNPFIDSKYNIPRGKNGGITAMGNYLYVGTDTAMQPGLVVDMTDMTKPTVVGEVPTIKGKSIGREAIESVPDLNLLVASVNAAEMPGWVTAPADKNIGMFVYDATNRTKPTIVAKVDAFNASVHYMTLWRDPKKPDRVLADLSYSGAPDGVDIRVWDLTGCPKTCNPPLVGEWGLRSQMGIPQTVVTKYEGGTRSDGTTTHDNTFSLDGRRIHMAQTRYGYLQLDSSALADGKTCDPKAATSPNQPGHCLSVLPGFQPLTPFGIGVASTHGVVKIPGRPYVSLAHEGYQCPYGGLTIAYVGDVGGYQYATWDFANQKVVAGQGGSTGDFRGDLFPRAVSTFSVPEQNPDRCPKPGETLPATTGTTGVYGADLMEPVGSSHDVLAFPDLMFASWYGAGLRAIDITNPFTPFEVGYYFMHPSPEVRWCNSQGGPCADQEVDAEGVPVRQKNLLPPELLAKSYPITMNGYVIYSDNNFGISVLKYIGPHANEIPDKGNCIAKQPNTQAIGYEPCAPYNDTWRP